MFILSFEYGRQSLYHVLHDITTSVCLIFIDNIQNSFHYWSVWQWLFPLTPISFLYNKTNWYPSSDVCCISEKLFILETKTTTYTDTPLSKILYVRILVYYFTISINIQIVWFFNKKNLLNYSCGWLIFVENIFLHQFIEF